MNKFYPFFIFFLVSLGVSSSYTILYYSYLFDFSESLPLWKIVAAHVFFSLLLFGVIRKLKKPIEQNIVTWRITLVVLTIISTIFPILKRNVAGEFPELYPGFAVPLHYIFLSLWLAFEPKILENA
jgi:MFS superfamily sulfate permease-like transporter